MHSFRLYTLYSNQDMMILVIGYMAISNLVYQVTLIIANSQYQKKQVDNLFDLKINFAMSFHLLAFPASTGSGYWVTS